MWYRVPDCISFLGLWRFLAISDLLCFLLLPVLLIVFWYDIVSPSGGIVYSFRDALYVLLACDVVLLLLSVRLASLPSTYTPVLI